LCHGLVPQNQAVPAAATVISSYSRLPENIGENSVGFETSEQLLSRLQDHLRLQPSGLTIVARNASLARFDATLCDRQSKTRSSGLAIACRFRTEERFENPFQRILGNAGTGIRHRYYHSVPVAMGGDVDRTIGARIAHRVADQVGKCSKEVLLVALYAQMRIDRDLDRRCVDALRPHRACDPARATSPVRRNGRAPAACRIQ